MLRVRQARTILETGVENQKTKTPSSVRGIQIPSTPKAALLEHREAQTREREDALNAWTETGPVFTTEAGDWVYPGNLNRALRWVLEWSDPSKLTTARLHGVPREHRARLEAIIRDVERLPGLSPRDLRHTYATLALRRGNDRTRVTKTLRHARISITLDIYNHVLALFALENVIELFEMVSKRPR